MSNHYGLIKIDKDEFRAIYAYGCFEKVQDRHPIEATRYFIGNLKYVTLHFILDFTKPIDVLGISQEVEVMRSIGVDHILVALCNSVTSIDWATHIAAEEHYVNSMKVLGYESITEDSHHKDKEGIAYRIIHEVPIATEEIIYREAPIPTADQLGLPYTPFQIDRNLTNALCNALDSVMISKKDKLYAEK